MGELGEEAVHLSLHGFRLGIVRGGGHGLPELRGPGEASSPPAGPHLAYQHPGPGSKRTSGRGAIHRNRVSPLRPCVRHAVFCKLTMSATRVPAPETPLLRAGVRAPMHFPFSSSGCSESPSCSWQGAMRARRLQRRRSPILATATAIRSLASAASAGSPRTSATGPRTAAATRATRPTARTMAGLPAGRRVEGVPRRMARAKRGGLAGTGTVAGNARRRDRKGERARRAGGPPPQVRRRHRLQRALLGLDRSPPEQTALGRWAATPPTGLRRPGPPDDVSATAWHRDVATDRNSIWRSPVNVTYWLSVRCVRETASK